MTKGRSSEYFKNTAVLFVGKFATQFSSLLLIPIFTRRLSADDYGLVDLLQSYISLIAPILIFRMDSAVLRFLIEARNDREKQERIVSNVISIVAIGILIALTVFVPLSIFTSIKYLPLVLLSTLSIMLSNVLLQILRGIGDHKTYSIASIIAGILNLSVNLLLVLALNFGADSILIASAIANIACSLFIVFKINLPSYFKKNRIKKSESKKLLHFSLPMIPNALSWWIVSISDRTIITTFINAAANGIYAIACKFPNVLYSLSTTFNMSWAEMAALHINDEDRNTYFNHMINKLLFLFVSLGILMLAGMPFVYRLVIGEEYYSAYYYIPLLIIAHSWSVFTWLAGGIYVALKKTKGVMNTTLISAAVNIGVDLLLIKYIGIYAACVSTLVSYIVMAAIRYVDSRKYVKYRLDYKKVVVSLAAYSICISFYYSNSIILFSIGAIVAALAGVLLNASYIAAIKRKIQERFIKD